MMFMKNRIKINLIKISIIPILLIFILSTVTTITAATGDSGGVNSRADTAADATVLWYSETIFKGTEPIDGCAIGDCYPENDGNEVIFCNREYKLYMSYKRPDETWNPAIELWKGSGQPLTPAIGDFDPDHDGNEIILVGMGTGLEGEGGGGVAIEIYYDQLTEDWKTKVIYNNPKMLHGVAIGDIDPTHSGDEVVVVGFAYNVTLLKRVNDNWESELMWHDDNNIRKAVIDNFDSEHDGDELVVVSKSGKATMIYWNGTDWEPTVLFEDPDGLARVAVGDCDPDNTGKEVVVGGDSGKVTLIRGSGKSWDANVIFTDTDKNRGVWIDDADPLRDGNEIIAFGYSNKVTEITGHGNTWEPKTIWIDIAKGHEVCIGEFDLIHEGNEIIAVGYSNNATMVARRIPDFGISTEEATKQIASGDNDTYIINLKSLEGFKSELTFNILGIPEFAKYDYSPQTLVPDGNLTLNVEIPPTMNSDTIIFYVNATGGDKAHSLTCTLIIQGDTNPPTVNINNPVNTENVLINTSIDVKFNEPMNQTSVNANFSISPHVNGAFTWNGDDNLIYKLESNLNYNETYIVRINKKSMDLAGNTLAENCTFKFNTTTELTLKFNEPTSTENENVHVKTIIIVIFDKPMNSDSVVASFYLSSSSGPKVNGTPSWNEGNNEFTFKPDITLEYDTKYTITIDEYCIDSYGNKLNENYTLTFTTKNAPADECNTILLPILTIAIIVILLFVGHIGKKEKERAEKAKDNNDVNKKAKPKKAEPSIPPSSPPAEEAATSAPPLPEAPETVMVTEPQPLPVPVPIPVPEPQVQEQEQEQPPEQEPQGPPQPPPLRQPLSEMPQPQQPIPIKIKPKIRVKGSAPRLKQP